MKKRILVLKIAVISLAGLLIAFVLSYYNFIIKDEKIVGVPLHFKPTEFKLKVYDGNGLSDDDPYTLEKSKGRVVIFNFWATTCNPCIHELPYFNDLKEKYGDEVDIIAIHGVSITEDVQEFINNSSARDEDWKEYDITFAQDAKVVEYNGDLLTAFNAFGGKDVYPVTVMFDANGVFSYVRQGSITFKTLEEAFLKVKNGH